MLFILMLQLHSTQKLLLVMLTAPLAIIGVAIALLLSNRPFGFVAMLGVFALVGMIIRNSVVFMAQIKDNEDAGMERGAAIVDATMHRLRPILLTAAAAILGLIPIAGEVFWGPMAIAMMGGLFIATDTHADLPAGAVRELVSREKGVTSPTNPFVSRVALGASRSYRGATAPAAASIAFSNGARGSASGIGRSRARQRRARRTGSFRAACPIPLRCRRVPRNAPRRCRRAARAALRHAARARGSAFRRHVVVDLVRHGIGHVFADHREQHVRPLQLGEQRRRTECAAVLR